MIESFNGRLRDEFLKVDGFITVHDTREKMRAWQHDYNVHRPHGSPGHLTPSEFVKCGQANNPKATPTPTNWASPGQVDLELRDVREPHLRFNRSDYSNGILEAIVAENLLLDAFETFRHFLVSLLGKRVFPSRENDGVFACGVMFVHQFK